MPQATVELGDKEMDRIEAVAPADDCAASIATIPSAEELAQEDRRQSRLAILMRSSGIWGGEPNKPKDGLAYQAALRAEWR
ncbi:MAG: hypothetical protein V4462_00560 [Pseudomonadota bacterium]